MCVFRVSLIRTEVSCRLAGKASIIVIFSTKSIISSPRQDMLMFSRIFTTLVTACLFSKVLQHYTKKSAKVPSERKRRAPNLLKQMRARRVVFSFASSQNAKVLCGDLERAFFKGERTVRMLVMQQPRSGLPGLRRDNRVLSRVPLYGAQDVGRGFWHQIRRVLIDGGVREKFVLKAVYTLTVGGELKELQATHVDDVWYSFDDEAEGQSVIKRIV